MGTPGYMTPEIAVNDKHRNKSKQYDNKVDIYALGILILRMLGLDIPQRRIERQTEFTKRVKSLTAGAIDSCGDHDYDRFDILTMADRMLQFAPAIRPSAHECLQLPCLDLATGSPAAMHWRSPSASVSITRSVASLTAKSSMKSRFDSTGVSNRHKPRGVPKRDGPRPRDPQHKVHKRKHYLPTPKATPQKANKGRKNEEGEPEETEMAEDSSSPVSRWDDMSTTD